MIDKTQLSDGAKKLEIDLSFDQIDRFDLYATRLIEWNTRFNLTSIVDPSEIVIKHFLDSLSAAQPALLHAVGQGLIPRTAKLIDVGAGAGFPGLPLKIVYPELSLTLLEATKKKCDFLEAMIAELKLSSSIVVNARAEDAAQNVAHREQYGVAIARAVAELPTLSEYLLPFVKRGGLAIAMKSKDVQEETKRAEAAIKTLGGQLKQIVPVTIPGLNEERSLVVIEKISATPEKYPRRAGMPSKKPIE
jgi:16S rRNA (guanine527-N7)-methyltransferase